MPNTGAEPEKGAQMVTHDQDQKKNPINNNEVLKESKDWPVLQLERADWPVLKLEVDLLTGMNEEDLLEAMDLEDAIEEEEREEQHCSFRLR